jgi:hypothetical protein
MLLEIRDRALNFVLLVKECIDMEWVLAFPELVEYGQDEVPRQCMPNFFKAVFRVCVLVLTLSSALLAQRPVPANAADGSTAKPLASVPASRFDRLRRGINLSHWFAQSPTGKYERERLTTYMTAADIDLIERMGFEHARLTLEPDPLFNQSQPDHLNAEYLVLLDSAVQMLLERGLAVIIDVHPSGDFKQKLGTERGIEAFVDFWHSLAAHYANTDPERVFFEVLNEPEMSDGYRWYGVQASLIAGIRSATPRHTIIATGHGWSAVDTVVPLQPFSDGNIVYNFHYYEPHIFTHQGATWGSELWHHLPRVHYPSHPGADEELIKALLDYSQKLELVRYDQNRWSRERIDSEIGLVAAWAAEHNVRVTCNEFGVYRQYADPKERIAWLNDVRLSLEAHGMGWTMWDYAGGFGVATGEPGKRVPDQQVLKALGLSK